MKKHEGHHKYIKTIFKQSGTEIFRCILPNCAHFLYEPMIVGRISLCNRCGESYEITPKSTRAKKMHCEACSRDRYNRVKVNKLEIPTSIDRDLDKLLYDIEEANELTELGNEVISGDEGLQ